MISASTKDYSFSRFDGGINKYALKTDIKDNQLSDAKNMYFDGKALRTREGVEYDFSQQLPEEFDNFSIRQIGSGIQYGELNVQFYLIWKTMTYGFCNYLFVIKSDGTHSLIQLKTLYGKHVDQIFKESRATLVCGGESENSGIYILLGAVDQNGVFDKAVLELTTSLDDVIEIPDSQIYAPTVLINGKGSIFQYSDSLLANEFPMVKGFESFNCLSGRFKAYFKTDGISAYYLLPCKTLSKNEGEVITIYFRDAHKNEYSWTIKPDANVSEEIVLYNELKVKMYVDRSRSRIFSMDADSGAPAALPIIYGVQNNLEIIAYKPVDYNQIFGMSVSENFNARSYLSGNDMFPNHVRFSAKANPLYFPETNLSYFGENTSSVTGMCRQNDRIILFKPHSIALCSQINEKLYNLDSIINSRATIVNPLESMEIKTVSSTIGSIYPQTFASCANRLVFLGSDKNVYTITSTSNYTQRLYNISKNVSPLIYALKNFKQVFASDINGQYMLFFDNKCFLFGYNTREFLSASQTASSKNGANGVAWYYFEYNFGETVPCGVIRRDNKAYFVTKGNARLDMYKSGGEQDLVLDSSGNKKSQKIQARFSTRASDLDCENLKNVIVVSLVFNNLSPNKSHGLDISYFDENASAVWDIVTINPLSSEQLTIQKVPCVFGLKNFGFTLIGTTPFALKCADIKYR